MSDDIQQTLRQLCTDTGYIKGLVESIEEQTKKTNGRVTKQEIKLNRVVIGFAILATALFILNPQIQEVIKLILHL